MNDLSLLLELQGQVRIERVDSPALHDNPLGDPSVRPLAVYTPPGYDPSGSRTYPVLYCLHGYTGSVAGLVAVRAWETNVVQWADRLIVEGKMPPAIVAIVDGFTRLGGSQYVDSIHNGGYATYTVRDVIGYVDAHYRTIAGPGGRGVFGKSSGGFGALHLSLAYPGVFGAFASHSGDAYFPYCYPIEFPAAMIVLEQHGGSIAAFVDAFEARNKKPPPFFALINQLGMAAAYSPRAAERWAIDLPFDTKTGQIREDVFARWLAFDPVERVAAGRDALAAMRLCYLDCGTRDEYGLFVGARIFAQRCRDLGLAVRHEEFDDDHRNVGYRYAVSLPALAQALERA